MAKAIVQTEFEKTIYSLTGTYQTWQIWADWVYMFAAAMSQVLDFRENREQCYKDIAAKYSDKDMQMIKRLNDIVTDELDRNPEQDFLGNTYMKLNLGNHWTGQFFTPYHVCQCTAQMQCDECVEIIKEKGYVTISDSACGGGATLIAAVNAVHHDLMNSNSPLNFQNHILVMAQDLSKTTALMCYIQLSLLGIAAIVKVGDSLADPMTGDPLDMPKTDNLWFTPMYNLPVWAGRQVCHKLDLLAKRKIQEVIQ